MKNLDVFGVQELNAEELVKLTKHFFSKNGIFVKITCNHVLT